MLYANDTLATLTGAVQQHKQNASASQCEMWLNWRMRYIFDSRPYWTGAITRGVLQCPAAYSTGTVSTATGSNIVVGVGTAWPVNDVVNTILTTAITQPGSQNVVPASMANITPDTWLYVDSASANPEIVYVLDTTAQAFTAVFNSPHSVGATATASSFASRTIRLGYQVPNFLILAVTSPTTLVIQNPFGGLPLTNIAYTILKNLYNFAPDLKELMSVVDPQQGLELGINYPQAKLNQQDPQRTSTAFPILVSPHSMSPAGTHLFEIWPSPTNARQLYFEYYAQPKDLRAPGDRPPAYLNPQVMAMGATADALRTKITPNDPYYNPDMGAVWEQRFAQGLDMLIFADNSINNQAYTWRTGAEGYPTGANWDRAHSEAAWFGDW